MFKIKENLREDNLDLVICVDNILLDNKYKLKTKIDKLPKEKHL